MPSFEVEFEVFCACGAGLCNQSTGRNSRRRDTPQVEVEVCRGCRDEAWEAGFQAGLIEGERRCQ